MSTMQSRLLSMVCFVMLSGLLACQTDYTSDILALETTAGRRVVVDLITHDTYAVNESYEENIVSMAGCQVLSRGLPENAFFDGQFLVWTPLENQEGIFEISLEYRQGCWDRIPAESDFIQIEVGRSGESVLFRGKVIPPRDTTEASSVEMGELQVHDLETLS